MSFNFNAKNPGNNKHAFRTLIARKQQFFNRLVRRFKASTNPAERSFLKTEAKRVITELKNFSAQWKKNGFGNNAWVTRGVKTANLRPAGSTRSYSKQSRTRNARNSSRRTRSRAQRSRNYSAYAAW